MCMADITIGRNTAIVFRKIVVTGAAFPFVDADPKRVMLILIPDPTAVAPYSLSTDVLTSFGEGIVIKVTDPPLTLRVEQHGQLLTKALYVQYAGAFPITLYFVEGTLAN